MPADRFTMPTTPEEWDAVEPSETDVTLTAARGLAARYCVLAAASRLLERERCIAALALHLGGLSGEQREAEARRILEGGE